MGPNPKKEYQVKNKEVKFKDLPELKPKTELETPSLEIFSKLLFWGEKYNEVLEGIWSKIPIQLGAFIASLGMFILGMTARGEWLLHFVYLMKYLESGGRNEKYIEDSHQLVESVQDWFNIRFEGYLPFLLLSTVVSYVLYFGIGGFLHWYYYVRQRDKPEEWKCQPNHWLSPALERHEIMSGSLSLIFGSIISAAISTYLKNGGWSLVYYDFLGFGWLWMILQWPIIFIYQDYGTYWIHRMFHIPFLYKNFHKLHHTYKQPTAFSVTAIHPVELIFMQFFYSSPIFLFPIHFTTFGGLAIYTYYHGILNHSGINFKHYWWQPWQPDSIFHDNHHQYFHVNFGFNIGMWDKIHGTYRRKDRIYREDIFYGFGKSISEASEEELQTDITERLSENPLAYQGNKRHFDLDEKTLKMRKK